MAKKSRRARAAAASTAAPTQRPETRQPQAAAGSAVGKTARKAGGSIAAAVQQPVNYDYVKSDLVHIGIIAGALILVIIVLTFIPALR